MARVPSGTPAKSHRSWRMGRILLLVGLSVIGLLALMVALLPYVVSLEPVKDQIVMRLETALQRQVDVGAVHLQILGGLGAGFEDLTIYNPPGWSQAHLLKVETLSAKVAWRPLLQRRIEVTEVVLHGGDIVIERDANGRVNIADLIQAEPTTETAPPAPSPPSPHSDQTQPAGQPPADLQVSEVTLQDVTIGFIDHRVAPGQALTTTVSDVRLDLRDIAPGTPIPFDLTATALTDGRRNLRARGHVGPLPTHSLSDGLPVDVRVQITDVLLRPLLPYLGAAFPLTQGRVGAEVTMQGQVGANLEMQGTFTLVEAVLHDTIGGEPPNPLPALNMTYDLALDMAEGRLHLAKAEVDLSGVQATMTGTVHRLLSTPQVDLRLSTNSFAPAELLTDFPALAATFPSPTELHGRAQLQTTLQGSPQDLRAEGQLNLQEIALKGGTFNGGRPEGGGIQFETDDAHALWTLRREPPRPPHLQMDIRARRVVFDREAAREVAADAPKDPTSGSPSSPPSPPAKTPPVQPWQSPVTLNGQIDIAEGWIQGVNVQQMTVDVTLRNGTLTSRHQVRVYEGTYQGDVQVDLAQKAPRYTANAKLLDLNVGQALNELTPIKDALLGALNTDVHLSGQGLTWDLISRTLTGEGAFMVSGAKLTTFDLVPKLVQLLRGVGALTGMTIPADWQHDPFNTIEGHMRLQQGKIWTDAVKLRGQGLEAILKGYVGLDQSLDYMGTVFLPSTVFSYRGPLALLRRDDTGRVMLPFAVRGTVKSPHIAFDESYVKDVARDALLEQLKKRLGGTTGEDPQQPPTGEGQTPQPGQTGQDEGTKRDLRDLPRRILQDLLKR